MEQFISENLIPIGAVILGLLVLLIILVAALLIRLSLSPNPSPKERGDAPKTWIGRFFKTHNEWVLICFGLIGFFTTPSILRLIDPTASHFDLGELHFISLGFVKACFAAGAAWNMFKFSFPELHFYFENQLETDLKRSLSRSEETINLSCAKYSIFLFSFYTAVITVLMLKA